MSNVNPEAYRYLDGIDDSAYVLSRRLFSYDYAEHPVEFNVEGMRAGAQFMRRPFTPDDLLLDIGSSSGIMAAEAALSLGTDATIICTEPAAEAAEAYARLPKKHRDRINFIAGDGEQLPFSADTFTGVLAHNVIFRAQDPVGMLKELKRVVQPGGFIALSTNAEGHAPIRHHIEHFAARVLNKAFEIDMTPPRPPAERTYLHEIPDLVRQVGGLGLVDELYVSHFSRTILTPERGVADYLWTIQYSAATTELPAKQRWLWRETVRYLVEQELHMQFSNTRLTDPVYESKGPYFADPIERGMYFIQKNSLF